MPTYSKSVIVTSDDDPANQAIVFAKSPGAAVTCRVVLGQLEHSDTLATLLPLAADRAALAALLAKVRANTLAALGMTAA